MNLSTQPYKGARDFYPEDKQVQNHMFDVMKKVAKSYGYQEYDAPILEPVELYKAKTGDEIVNEQTYTFTDRGGREVVIRPEMTPTVSRMVAARRQELAYPLRWFSIPNLWRYERPQRGRLREHWQLNVDLFGIEGIEADHEIIEFANSLLKEFGATSPMFRIEINSRQLVNEIYRNFLGLDDEKSQQLMKLVDKIDKIDKESFDKGLAEVASSNHSGISAKVDMILAVKELDDLPKEVQAHESVGKLKALLQLLDRSRIDNVTFNLNLMRGFDYYTDIVFEVFDANPENNRSMFGGGRYDGLVGLFGVDPVPTVGFGMGDVTLRNFLEGNKLLPELGSETDVLMILIGDVYEDANQLSSKMREMGLNVSIDPTSRKLDKKIRAAEKQGIRYVVFVGENELAEEQFPLKDIISGNEEKHSLERLVGIIKDYRS
jgi:histidyl-tRNA synthetase